jgi:hypothetical protein
MERHLKVYVRRWVVRYKQTRINGPDPNASPVRAKRQKYDSFDRPSMMKGISKL